MAAEGDQAVPEPHAPSPSSVLSPDGRFAFDGQQWRAVPLPPEIAIRRRRIPPAIMWLLVAVAAIVGGAIIFYVLVAVGLSATHT
jgi:hypothetical protein